MYIPQQHTNARTQELTTALRATLAMMQAKHPKLTPDEVRGALRAVTPGAADSKVKVAAMIATGLLFLGSFGAVIFSVETRQDGRPVPWILLAGLLVPFAALVLVLWFRTGDD